MSKIMKSQKEVLPRYLIKNHRKLKNDMNDLTKEEASMLIKCLQKNDVSVPEVKKFTVGITKEEFEQYFEYPLYNFHEVLEMIRGLTNKNKRIDSDVLQNAILFFKAKDRIDFSVEDGKSGRAPYYYTAKFVEFLKVELSKKEVYQKILYYLEEGVKYHRFKDDKEKKMMMKKWGLDSKQVSFEFKYSKDCRIIGYDQYDRICIELKPNSDLKQLVNPNYFKSFNE